MYIISFLILSGCNLYLKDSNKVFKEDRVFHALATDDFNLFQMYFESLDDKNVKDQLGNSLLHLALKHDKNDFIEYLLSKEISVLSLDNDCEFPEESAKNLLLKDKLKKIRLFEELKNALAKSSLKLLQMIIKKQEIKNFRKDDNLKNLITFYLEQINKTKEYNEEILNLIINNYPELINGLEDKSSPLHTALDLYEEDKDLFINSIRVLISRGANLLKEDRYKITPLEIILKSKDENLLNTILDISISKFNLVKSYIDNCIEELKLDINRKINITFEKKDYYYLVGSFLRANENYLKDKKETIKFLLLTLALKDKNYSILTTTAKLEDKDRNKDLFSGHKLIDLKVWDGILKNDIIYGEYFNKINLEKDKEYFSDKINRINNEAKGDDQTKKEAYFNNQRTAKYAKSQLQKLFQVIHHKENDSDYMGKLKYTVNTLLESVNHCSTGVLESINHCLVYCLGNSSNKNLESWIEIKILQVKEEILDNIIESRGYFDKEQLDDSTHIKMFIKKKLGILPEDIVDSQFNDIEMNEIIGDRLQKIKYDFKKDFNEKLIEYILSQKIEKAIDKFIDYFDENIGAYFMGDIGEIIYQQEGTMQVRTEALKALLYLNKYIDLEEKE